MATHEVKPGGSGNDKSSEGGRVARLADVARAAGVHVSTVSRVLNGSAGSSVSAETHDRIVEIARRLRYHPNAVARGLKMASTGTLGLLVPSVRNPVFAEIIRGAFNRAWERNFVVVLAEDAGAQTAEIASERLVSEGRIDGLLIASARPGMEPLERRLREQGAPFVFLNRGMPGSGRNVTMRDEDAGRLAAEHLLSLGHERFAHVAGPAELDTARRRALGFSETVAAAGRECVVEHAPFEEGGGFAALGKILEHEPRADAVFVSNINQAVGVLAACRREGIRIPRDMSIVSYDDDPLAQFLEVALTTIRMPLATLGATAVDALLEQVAGEPARDIEVALAPVLIKRSSTARPGRSRL